MLCDSTLVCWHTPPELILNTWLAVILNTWLAVTTTLLLLHMT